MSAVQQCWALHQLTRLLPLDQDSLQQILTYTATLPTAAAADHLQNILGDESAALDFISAFNARRQMPHAAPSGTYDSPASGTDPRAKPRGADHIQQAGSSSHDSPASGTDIPRAKPRGAKRKGNIHALPPRQAAGQGSVQGAYRKRDEDDYMPTSRRQHVADKLAIQAHLAPDATQLPLITDSAAPTPQPIPSKPPPSAAGHLISSALAPRKPPSRTASPAPAAKISLTGGTAMHGAAHTVADLDSAIKSLELQTNPALSPADPNRSCNCMATRHPLLAAAPNCLHCGKIICAKEGLAPCTFCHAPLLSAHDIASTLRVLKAERGGARMAANNAVHKRADVAAGKGARALPGRGFFAATPTPTSSDDDADADGAAAAKAHRDTLLAFQADNAARTTVRDEAADFDLPASGTSVWASPAQRAAQLKRQQRVLRELEWSGRPEWEKRRVVASIDVAGGRVVRRMGAVERPLSDAEEEDGDGEGPRPGGLGGAFSRNPLLGALVRPIAPGGKGKERDGPRLRGEVWRRVQDDDADNERWILDGGMYGGGAEGRGVGEQEGAAG